MRAPLSCLAILMTMLLHADAGWSREWRVERLSGTAWTIESVEKRNVLAVGMMVPEGLTIATAHSGRIRLSNENNVMTLGPGSVAVVQPKGRFSSKTEVLQRVGSIAFDIEKRSSPHFTVQTPFMAAVVKGTSFTISVSKTDARIGVDRGLVQVSDLRTGETAGIGAGQRASVSANASGLSTAGINAPQAAPGKPSAPSVAPLGQTLTTARETHAAQAARSSALSAGSFAAAAASPSPSPGAAAAGGFGGDNSDGGDRAGIASDVSETRASETDTRERTGERDSRSEGSGEGGSAPSADFDATVNGVVGSRDDNRGAPTSTDGGGTIGNTVGDSVGSGSPGGTGDGGTVAGNIGDTIGDSSGNDRHHDTVGGGSVGNTVGSVGNGSPSGPVNGGTVGNTVDSGGPGGTNGGGTVADIIGDTIGSIGNTIGSIGDSIGNGSPRGGGTVAGNVGDTIGSIENTIGGLGIDGPSVGGNGGFGW